jgi:hypothetical protein
MKSVVRGVALVLLCLAIMTVRVVWSSRAEWKEGEASTGDARLLHLGRAARLYAPGNPYSRRALDGLAAVARAGGPNELAAWRETRSAILATRSFYTQRTDLLSEANARIAQLLAGVEPDSRGTLEARTAWHAARLAEDDAPSVGWTLVALLGLGGWIGGALGFFLRGVDERDKLRPRPAIACALGVAFGLALFFVGLAKA